MLHSGERQLPITTAGFTLIETLVALVILSSVLLAFYGLLSAALTSADRMNAAAIAYDRRANALELATAVNPMASPLGTFSLGTYRISWTSRLLGDLRRSGTYPAGSGSFTVGLYRVTLRFPDDPSTAPISVTRLGYRRDNVPGGLFDRAQPAPSE